MSWEFPEHMEQYIAPSIFKAAKEHGETAEHEANREAFVHAWLADKFADSHWIPEEGEYNDMLLYAKSIPNDELLNALTDKVKERRLTTNGGSQFYIDDWTTISWCTEEEMLEWWELWG